MKFFAILIVLILMNCLELQSQEKKATEISYQRVIEYIEKSKTLVESYFKYIMKTSIVLTEMGDFDAATNLDGDIPIIRINVRKILDYTDSSIYILLIHEMIHAVQCETTDIKKWNNKLALFLYLEGAAVYLSSIILPGYDEWLYITHYEKDSSSYWNFEKFEKKAAEYINNFLEEYNEIDITYLFKYSSRKKELPSRIGYYLGTEIIKSLGIKGPGVIGLKEEKYIEEVYKYLKKVLPKT